MPTHDKDWNATAYHRVSGPQTAWGREVLARLRLTGRETVLDAGCGTGKVTWLLAELLPQGEVFALDNSPEMLASAARELAPFGQRVHLVSATLPELPLPRKLDAILSTATLHWVLDHPALFQAFRRALRPGGQLEFQCGGAGNLELLHGRAHRLARTPEFSDAFTGWSDPWCLASAEETAGQLRAAGFTHVRTWLERRPTPFSDAAAFGDFVGHVVLRPFLVKLDAERAQHFTRAMVEAAARDHPPYVLDYVRLNASAFAR